MHKQIKSGGDTFVIYVRKSSESEDRQVLSIDSQISELKALAHQRNIEVANVLTEAQSAKTPGRPVFNQLIHYISQKQIKGVICWKLDRLARNPMDGAQMIQALESNKLQRIITPGQSYQNTTNDKFSLAIELCLAKRYVDDLSDNVRRGNRAKLERGWLPGPAPIGYLNDLATKTIITDPERSQLVRKIWDMALTDQMTVPQILKTINDKYGLKTRRTAMTGGKGLSRSSIYRLLADPFYYGLIVRNGESYQGAHFPMITKEEFDKVQMNLGRPGKSKPQRRYFPFTGLITCGECGAMVTAERKTNRYGSTYLYYHCTKRLTHLRCSQRSIRGEVLEEQMADILDSITIPFEFMEWGIERLRMIHKKEIRFRQDRQNEFDKNIDQGQTRLDNLLELRLRGLVSDEEYLSRKRVILDELTELKERRADIDGRQARWLEQAEQAFIFANHAKNWFDKGDDKRKRTIISCLGSNFTLKDKKLLIEVKKPFLILKEGRQKSDWLTVVDDIRTFFVKNTFVLSNSLFEPSLLAA